MAEEKTKLEDYQPGFVDESLQKTVKKTTLLELIVMTLMFLGT